MQRGWARGWERKLLKKRCWSMTAVKAWLSFCSAPELLEFIRTASLCNKNHSQHITRLILQSFFSKVIQCVRVRKTKCVSGLFGRAAVWVGFQCAWVHMCTAHELFYVLCLWSISVVACIIPSQCSSANMQCQKQNVTQNKRQSEGKLSVLNVTTVSESVEAETERFRPSHFLSLFCHPS